MEDSKTTFKTQYIGNTVRFSANFGFSLSRTEMKKLKSVFLLPYTEKLTQYKKAIDKFIFNHKEFFKMLQQSEMKYKQLPFKRKDNDYEEHLDHKSKIVKDQLDELTIKKELTELESFTGLTEFEKKKIARGKKRSLIKKQSEIQKEYEESEASVDRYNKSLKRKFVNDHWRGYNQFFMRNPAFKKIVNDVFRSYLEEEYSIKRNNSDYSLKDDLILLVRDKKNLNKKLREREVKFRKELQDKINSWENKSEMPFFPSIFTNSDLNLQVDKSTFEITFNIKLMYEGIIRLAYQYHGITYRQKSVSISDDRACIFVRLLLIIGLPKFLETEGMENLVKYSIVKGKSTFKFQFDEILKDLCRNFVKERKTLKTAPAPTITLKKKILQKVKVGVPLSAVVIVILVFSFLFFNIPSVTVEKYDSVKLDYTVWVSDEDENYDEFHPDVDIVIWLTVIPITENESTGLVLGLYDNILGKKVKLDSGLIWLNKCVDQDRDGIDDNTGQIALTYGNSTDLYFNTCLMIHFTILDIQKSSPSFFWDLSDNILIYIIGLILVIIGAAFLLMRTGIFISDRVQKRRLKPKLVFKTPRTRKFSLIKYGSLAISIPLLLLGVVGIINIATPLPEIILSSKYNPLVLPTLIGLMIGICILYIPIFLVASNVLYDKIHKK